MIGVNSFCDKNEISLLFDELEVRQNEFCLEIWRPVFRPGADDRFISQNP